MDRIEAFNGGSHLLGALLALAGTVVLLLCAAGDEVKLFSYLIYGVTLSLLYTSSALYHILDGRAKRLFRSVEHQAIYLLIAGSYTPFTLVTLQGRVGWWLCGTIWLMALLGMVVDARLRTRRRVIPTIIYLVMGWLIVVALEPLYERLPAAGFYWLLAGGLFYTAGVLFFALSHWYRWGHAVWHLFVLAGSVSHYLAILWYV